MPLDLNITPKPELSFTQPGGLVVFVDTPATVDVMLTPRAAGTGTIHLKCIADEVAFRDERNQRITSVLDFKYNCDDPNENQLISLGFILVCSNPSDQDILIRFDAWAKNATGQQSPPIMQLPVTLKPRNAESDSTHLTVVMTEEITTTAVDASTDPQPTNSPEEDPTHEDSATS